MTFPARPVARRGEGLPVLRSFAGICGRFVLQRAGSVKGDFSQIGRNVAHQLLVERLTGHNHQLRRPDRKRRTYAQVQLVLLQDETPELAFHKTRKLQSSSFKLIA